MHNFLSDRPDLRRPVRGQVERDDDLSWSLYIFCLRTTECIYEQHFYPSCLHAEIALATACYDRDWSCEDLRRYDHGVEVDFRV